MESEDLVAALEQLDALARAEYHLSLEEVASQPGDDDERRLLRLGRLIGVTLKEPFADPRPLRPA